MTINAKARLIASQLHYNVFWSSEDQEYVARCDEFPYTSWLAITRRGALVGLYKCILGELRWNLTLRYPIT
jgi:hypothetical protein